MKKATFDRVCDLLNHNHAEVSWVCRADVRDGKPIIVRMARIVRVLPRDGAGRVRVAVTDWGESGQEEATHHYGTASGYGYDKTTAALDGATIGGKRIGDHSNLRGAPILSQLLRDTGWEMIGSL